MQSAEPVPPASYLVTFRDDNGSRGPLLRAVLDWLSTLASLEVIVVEQGARPRLDAGDLPCNARHVFAFNDGPFNKSWGLNVAARQARHDLMVIGDADMIMPGAALGRALAVCASDFDAVNPYAHLVDLDERQTAACLAGSLDLAAASRGENRDRRPVGEHLCFCGGICVFRRPVYFDLGGMDERFFGWGGEDDAMSVNLHRYTNRLAVQRDTVAFHLWHPRPPGRYTHAHYADNLRRAKSYATCDDEALAKWRAAQGASAGDPARFLRQS